MIGAGDSDALKTTKVVQEAMWSNNVRASTRGMKPRVIRMNGKYNVYTTESQFDEVPRGCHFLALVTDYGDHKKVRLFDRKGKQLKAPFYRLGRLGSAL